MSEPVNQTGSSRLCPCITFHGAARRSDRQQLGRNRKLDGEDRTMIGPLAGRLYRAAMSLRQALGNCQPESEASEAAVISGPPCSKAWKIRESRCGSIPIPVSETCTSTLLLSSL